MLVTAAAQAQTAPADSAESPDSVPPPTNSASAESRDADQTLRSYLRLQEQLHSALLAVEQARLEASLEAKTNADFLAARLQTLEHALTEQRRQQQETEHGANRMLLALGGVVLLLGLIALALTAFLQARGMNRLAEIALGTPGARMSALPQFGTIAGPSPTLLLAADSKAHDSDRLLATIGRLETRIHELEHSAQRSLGTGASEPQTPDPAGNGKPSAAPGDQVAGLLGKAQALLQLGQAEKALQCFDDAIARSPDNAEAFLGRGLALERLERFDDALRCYDRSMELGRSPTQASLRKAEILTRQERFAEALECYEHALRAGPKP